MKQICILFLETTYRGIKMPWIDIRIKMNEEWKIEIEKRQEDKQEAEKEMGDFLANKEPGYIDKIADEYIAEYSTEKIGKSYNITRQQMKKIENKGREDMIEILYGK
jgi:hypothetical protein